MEASFMKTFFLLSFLISSILIFTACDFEAIINEPDLTNYCAKSTTSGVEWNYCITKTLGGDSSHVLYYLHGKGGDAREWVDSYKNIRDYWRQQGIAAPIVVAVSFGKEWLLAPKNLSPKSGLLPLFTGTIMPKLEDMVSDYLKSDIVKRSIIGTSMGGFNATQIFSRYPRMFNKAAFLCPALVKVSPFDTLDKWLAYATRTGADIKKVEEMFVLSRIYFPLEANWNEASQFNLGEQNFSQGANPFYISCGDKDEYGFFEGATLFKNLAKSFGVNVLWDPIKNGTHCSSTPAKVADFITD